MTTSTRTKSKRRSFYYILTAFVICMSLISLICQNLERQEVLSKVGSSGKEVSAIQQALKDRGLFNSDITGYYGTQTQAAVRKFQKQKGLTVDGIAGPQTLGALGISVGTVPKATEANINLLARIISAEARGEPYTISGVIYQNGAFTAVNDGQFWQPVAASAYNAARDALNGWDPSGGAIYYYNPAKTSNRWIRSRPVITTIGDHVFCS